MKYISIILMLLFASACQTPTKKGKKFTWQDNTSTQERTIASSPQTALPGEFIYLQKTGFGTYDYTITPMMSKFCDSRKSFTYIKEHQSIICVKK